MGHHPLIERAHSKEVKQASAFRKAASELTGEDLQGLYQQELGGAPKRREAGKKYLAAWNARLAASRKSSRDADHLAIALLQYAREKGSGLALPDDAGALEPLHALVPLKSAQPDKSLGDADPNHGVDKLHLLALMPDDRLAVVVLKYAAPSATRGGTGDTPLRALLEGLANCAIVQANAAALSEELASVTDRTISDAPPALILMGSPRYWELCRRREAQKGAAWIKEMERLQREITEQLDVPVHYLNVRLDGDPGWDYDSGAPKLTGTPVIGAAWEPKAGVVKPKPKPRPKAAEPQEVIVEPDLSRPVQDYAITGSYEPGDRIQHTKLGLGVVQGTAGPGKIHVLFDGKRSLLVHQRQARL